MAINDSIATFEYTTIDAVVAQSKFRLGFRDNSDWDMQLRDFALTAYKRMRSQRGNLIDSEFVIEIENNSAKLPEGFVRFNRLHPVRFVNSNGGKFSESYNTPIAFNNTFYKCDPDEVGENGAIVVIQQVGDKLYFSNNCPTDYIKISGMCQLRDELGNILIPVIFEEFLTPFAAAQYCLAISDSRYEIFMREYRNNRKAVKGILQQSDALDLQLASWVFNSLL
jgi:hypothetical protein